MNRRAAPAVKDVVKGREDGSLLEVFGSGTVRSRTSRFQTSEIADPLHPLVGCYRFMRRRYWIPRQAHRYSRWRGWS